VGAGAIGSVIGGRLTEAGASVHLVDGWKEHVEAIQSEGLSLEKPNRTSTIPVKAVHVSELGTLESIDIVLLAVKSYDTLPMLRLVKTHLDRNAFVVSCQNGMNEEAIASVMGPSATLGCLVYFGAVLLGPGRVKQLRDDGRFIIGEYTGGLTKRIEILRALLSMCADTEITDSLRGERWSKLADNCSGNPLLVITGYTMKELHEHKESARIRRALIREIIMVAEALGERPKPVFGVSVELWKKPLSDDVPEIFDGFAARSGVLINTRSSMSYDFEQGREMELDALNGYVLKKGKETGVATPVNTALSAIVKDVGGRVLQPSPVHLTSLLRVVESIGS
jgi:2-dehydropantoate 2-reductase